MNLNNAQRTLQALWHALRLVEAKQEETRVARLVAQHEGPKQDLDDANEYLARLAEYELTLIGLVEAAKAEVTK